MLYFTVYCRKSLPLMYFLYVGEAIHLAYLPYYDRTHLNHDIPNAVLTCYTWLYTSKQVM